MSETSADGREKALDVSRWLAQDLGLASYDPEIPVKMHPLFECVDLDGQEMRLRYEETRPEGDCLGRGLVFGAGVHALRHHGVLTLDVAGVPQSGPARSDARFSPGSPLRLMPYRPDNLPGAIGVGCADGRCKIGMIFAHDLWKVRALYGRIATTLALYEWLGDDSLRQRLRILIAPWDLNLRPRTSWD